jgi:hypothetical protein
MRGADLFHHTFDKVIEDAQFVVERFDERLIGLNPHDKLGQHVVPAQNIDPASLSNVELTLQLGPKAFMDLSGNPVFDLGVRERSLDFQQAVLADEPIRTTPHCVIVIGDEADPLGDYVLIECVWLT